ncbi:hypothetical protein EVAR_13443_1 [Eumeta japonica]|uniref:Uncharacterized protein n=1 Tax=Eumeta variegata TaxID=151549 RepID=A0A4C1V8G0_EUMVA|nr:hypothetical protein EVAR_13443_1 [Eumeta japonica]
MGSSCYLWSLALQHPTISHHLSLPSPSAHLRIPPSDNLLRIYIFTQEVGNALVISRRLRVSTSSGDHLYSVAMYVYTRFCDSDNVAGSPYTAASAGLLVAGAAVYIAGIGLLSGREHRKQRKYLRICGRKHSGGCVLSRFDSSPRKLDWRWKC